MSQEDRAQEHEAFDWARRNGERKTATTYAHGDDGYSPGECVDCEEDMPINRRRDGCKLCTACQSLKERRR
jgi:RNA polymerase-binding transcription factor DksA